MRILRSNFQKTKAWEGEDATAAKKLIGENEKQLLADIKMVQNHMISLQNDFQQTFLDTVSDDKNAIIYYDSLTKVDKAFDNYYLDFKAIKKDVNSTLEELKSYTKYGQISSVDFSEANKAFKKFCGYDNTPGYIGNCKERMEKFAKKSDLLVSNSGLASEIQSIDDIMKSCYSADKSASSGNATEENGNYNLNSVATMDEINDFWLNNDMFAYPYWYQKEENMELATYYLRSEIINTGPYKIIKPGKLTDAEKLKRERIGVLLRLLANADIKAADDYLLPALENSCSRYGKDFYDIGYNEEKEFVVTEELLDILVKNEQERIGQPFGFWMERGGSDIVDGLTLLGMGAAYSAGESQIDLGEKTESKVESEIDDAAKNGAEAKESVVEDASKAADELDAGKAVSKGGNYSVSIIKETDRFIDYENKAGTIIRFVKQDQNAINNSISSKMTSSTVGDVVESKVGNFIQSSTDFELTDFGNKVKKTNGATMGDIDCATQNTLIEVKNSVSSVKVKQIDKYINPTDVNYINVENKQVVLYIEEPINYDNFKVNAMIKNLEEKGVIVVNSLEELKEVLK